ncbi:MarR family winged helix-turn-helix transcriptional regulator [Actinomadura livida]|uniref:MarR family transcriptional regulator n=1 Tax=Actinomadura livida TaxID=79909 RepID=A0A7W7IEK9_9ACTN|nr:MULTISPECIES: MarR family winged helix-turn-helix transcriptional regulator [Actinomadura]MBB4775293.1 DNA-binding MarR family transcriptional regulator [Actinomadura catellatispora]GGT89272.1 MarR family transcriptional regulator [Actinomadura livida]
MSPTRRPEIAAQEAWRAYRRLQLLVDAEVARDLERASGLSLPDHEVLAAVVEMAGGEHCIRVGRLTARMGWAHARLSRQLGRMERRGLIAREPCELDGRGDDVLLTDAGRDAYERAAPAHAASVERHLTGLLTPEQLDVLIGIEQTIADRR